MIKGGKVDIFGNNDDEAISFGKLNHTGADIEKQNETILDQDASKLQLIAA